MGCDIHIIAEVKEDGVWRENTDKVFYDTWPSEGNHAEPNSNRNYDWFAVLADVRNGRGFAGVKTGDGFIPIADPRGTPDDCNEAWKQSVEEWGIDMHSTGWLDANDFVEYDWTRKALKQGSIPLHVYANLEKGAAPKSSGHAWGRDVINLTPEKADKLLKSGHEDLPGENLRHNVLVQWEVQYREYFNKEWENIIDPLIALTKKYEDARLVFGFDN